MYAFHIIFYYCAKGKRYCLFYFFNDKNFYEASLNRTLNFFPVFFIDFRNFVEENLCVTFCLQKSSILLINYSSNGNKNYFENFVEKTKFYHVH